MGLRNSRLIIMILFLLFVGAIAYFVIRHFDRAQSHHHSHVHDVERRRRRTPPRPTP